MIMRRMHQLCRSRLLLASPGRPLNSSEAAPVVTRYAQFSSNITYSGGHASEGQGGFYASGGRASSREKDGAVDPTTRMLALAADVEKITAVMQDLEKLESVLEGATDPTSTTYIETKTGIKKLMTNPDVSQSLNRLEVQGEPVWGLSTAERELITMAREKANEC